MRRVVVTGVGVVSPVGIGPREFWKSLCEGISGVGAITRFDASSYPVRIAAEVKGFDPLQYMEKKDLKKMDLFIQYGLAAGLMSAEDARLQVTPENSHRIGVLVGAGIGGLWAIEEQHKILMSRGPSRISPHFIPSLITNLAAGQISIRLGAKGPNSCVATACATGTHAIGDSFKIIQRGAADVMIAGGCESAITPLALAGFSAMRALSARNDDPPMASRPFDAQRDGFVMGEGAGILILEELNHALSRGVPIYAEVSGYGMSGDAYHITATPPGGEGAVRCMRSALEDAGVGPEEVDYINAHGTSTGYNDLAETQAIKAVFGDHAYRLPVSSIKSMIGHLLGAAGAVEAAATALTIKDGILPPTINYEFPDPGCDLDYVPNRARKAEVRYALSNSFGFGGTNASLILKRFEG
ncbi:MAG: beta-ketoacyl-ACP synthase II [bacterium]|jgi:3-oxoacyl-[acyl-carrier-protein] synthase II